VNTRARINIPFGTALTNIAKLPDGAERALTDPYGEKTTPWKTYIALALLLMAIGVYFAFPNEVQSLLSIGKSHG
jgi:hypothetical protein